MFLYFFIVAVLLLAITYWYFKEPLNYWKRQNVPSAPNAILGFGHMLPLILVKENILKFAERLYDLTDASAIGFYFLRTPGIVVRDPELIKCIMQNNFSSFTNLISLDENNDPVLSNNPFFVKDVHHWKTTRSRIVNHLSVRKMKILFQFLKDVTVKMNNFIDRKITENDDGFYECQLKEFCERYTGEFVANSGFGIEGESYDDNPSPTAFTNIARLLIAPTFINGIKQPLIFYLPGLAKYLKVSFLPNKADAYFRETLHRMIKERKQKGLNPNDYLQFCLEGNPEEDFNKIIADIISFYLDTYETSSLTISILFYVLSKHRDVQEKLRKHVATVLEKTGGEITFDCLKEMTYMDQVMFESLRMMSSAGVLQKMCTEEITLTGSDGKSYNLKPGYPVLLPICSLHRDEKYFADPHTFNPDRFTPENFAKINKYAYLPFGEGPRMCPGLRFGQMIVKLGTASILQKFSIEHSPITIEPLEREFNSFLTYHKGGLWGRFKRLS